MQQGPRSCDYFRHIKVHNTFSLTDAYFHNNNSVCSIRRNLLQKQVPVFPSHSLVHSQTCQYIQSFKSMVPYHRNPVVMDGSVRKGNIIIQYIIQNQEIFLRLWKNINFGRSRNTALLFTNCLNAYVRIFYERQNICKCKYQQPIVTGLLLSLSYILSDSFYIFKL